MFTVTGTRSPAPKYIYFSTIAKRKGMCISARKLPMRKGSASFGEAITDKDGHFDRFLYARVPGRLVGVSRSAKWKGEKQINPDLRVVLQPSRPVEGQVTVPPGFNPAEVTVHVRTLHVVNGPGDHRL